MVRHWYGNAWWSARIATASCHTLHRTGQSSYKSAAWMRSIMKITNGKMVIRRLGEIHAFDGLHRLSKNLWAALSGIQTLDAKNVFLILNDFNSFNLSLKKSSLIKKSLIRIFIILFDQTVWVASIPATENLRESWKQNWSKQLSNDRSRCIFKVKIV